VVTTLSPTNYYTDCRTDDSGHLLDYPQSMLTAIEIKSTDLTCKTTIDRPTEHHALARAHTLSLSHTHTHTHTRRSAGHAGRHSRLARRRRLRPRTQQALVATVVDWRAWAWRISEAVIGRLVTSAQCSGHTIKLVFKPAVGDEMPRQ
jgi:hypothetical protein